MNTAITRRQFAKGCLAASVAAWQQGLGGTPVRAEDSPRTVLGIGFSLYGCPKMTLADATALINAVGYDTLELPLMPGWPGQPEVFSADARKAFRDDLVARNLTCAALMEHLPLAVPEADWAAQAARLQRAAVLARDLSPRCQPLVETVVGGKPGEWDKWKAIFTDRLRAWAKLADSEGLVIAVKPHVSSALDQPAFCRDLITAVDSPRIRLAFDFSHFVHRGFDLVETARTLAPISAFVHLKDRAMGEKAVRFVLPGEGAINTSELLRTLVAAGYRGPVIVEVSAQVHSQSGYSAKAAAESSYRHLVSAWESAGLARPS